MPTISLLYLPAGIAIGFLIGWLYMKAQSAKQMSESLSLQSQRETENRLLKEQVDALRSTEDLLRMELNEISLSNVRLETLLDENRKQTEQQQEHFEALSQKTLKALKEELEEKSNREYQQKQHMLDEKLSTLLKPLKDVIDQNEKRVKEVEKQHTEDTASLKKHIEMIVEETGKLVGVKNKLAEALSNSKGRGDWGEMELVRLLEHSGLIQGVHYEAQQMQDGLRPDITIKMSNQRILYVDAKTILVNLERLLGAEDTEGENVERKKHAAALEKEVLSLSLKSYETKCKESIDFVVLYVPRESMLRAALEERPALMEQAFQRRVILASPLILMSILKTVAYGWDQAQLSQKANEIHQLGRDLHKRAATYLERFVKVGERLKLLQNSYEDAEISLVGRQGMLPQLRKFEEYGCKSEKALPTGFADTEETDESLNGLLLESNEYATLPLSLPDTGSEPKRSRATRPKQSLPS
jgi:DNA recombination protein RmuC